MFYYWLKTQIDQNNPELKAKYNKQLEHQKKIEKDIIFFELSLGKIPAEKQKEFLASTELKIYHHYLKRLFDKSAHRLNEETEHILNLKASPAQSAWTKMVEGFISKDEKDIDGKKSFEEISTLMNSQKKSLRDKAARAFNEIMTDNLDVAEAEINAILANKKIDDELRKFSLPESERLLEDDVDKEFVDTLIKTVSSNYRIAHDFYKLKAKLLKQPKLAYHERNVPYSKIEKEYSYEEATDLVRKVFQNLDNKFVEIFDKFKSEGHIDVLPKKGKRNGAFCVYWLKSHPTYIMINFTNRLNDIRTIAHESGHGINNELIKKKQISLHYGTPTATAEVASTFMEDFVIQEIMKEADDELKLSLMMEKLNNDVSSIFRQIACYTFERELHSAFREKGYLSKEEIGKIFQKHMFSYMGPAVEKSPGSENWWVYWSHIRQFFYVYSYASGLLISKSLQAKVKQNPKYIEKVKEFLSAGTSDSPKNIFLNLGIDISKKEFWLQGLSEIESLLDETEKLARKLKKI
jgi:oligoendopeptidase F